MKPPSLSADEVRARCREEIALRFGTARAFARHLRVTEQYIYRFLSGRALPSGKILEYFGLEKIIRREILFIPKHK